MLIKSRNFSSCADLDSIISKTSKKILKKIESSKKSNSFLGKAHVLFHF